MKSPTLLRSVTDYISRRKQPATLFDVLVASTAQFPEKTAYIYQSGNEERQVSYHKVFEDVMLLARAFQQKGMAHGDKVLLLSDNRYAWIVTDMAIMSLGAASVPRGADTPDQELAFIIQHSGCKYVVLESEELFERHEELIVKSKQIKGIFVMKGAAMHTLFSKTYAYVELLAERTYSEKDLQWFMQLGQKLTGDDLLTLIYTSGTTGTPKGVQLSHENVMHNLRVIPDIIKLVTEDSWLSILPSWHIFERTAEYAAFAAGNTLIYSSVKTFAQDLEHYKPTLVATVPRVWESLYARVRSTIRKKGSMAMGLYHAMLWISRTYQNYTRTYLGFLPQYTQSTHSTMFFERGRACIGRIVLAPIYFFANRRLGAIRQKFGGRLRLAISGGGSLAQYLEDWIDAVGIRIVNAYGMTECAPAIAGRGLDCEIYGTLGKAVQGTELRLRSESGDLVPVGEEGLIEIKGPQVTQGYFNNDEENFKSFTKDGFFRTGDLGRLTVTGELVVTGRAKEIIVLANGENVDPTRIENTINMFPFVQDAILVGQDKKGLAALVVPNLEELRAYVADKFSHLKKETEELLTDGKILDSIKNDINKQLLPKLGFKPHEKLHGIVFLDREFKLGEELTNTLKKRRHVIERKYRQVINDLLH